jgi:hypothetical protein
MYFHVPRRHYCLTPPRLSRHFEVFFCESKIGVNSERLSVVRYGPVIIALIEVSITTIGIGQGTIGTIGIKSDCLSAVRYGPVIIALAEFFLKCEFYGEKTS